MEVSILNNSVASFARNVFYGGCLLFILLPLILESCYLRIYVLNLQLTDSCVCYVYIRPLTVII